MADIESKQVPCQFPGGFLWGATTASYQIEGSPDADGKAKSIWDEFTHRSPSPIYDKTNGDVACGSYLNISDDVRCLQELGCNTYRFSVSWPRVLPQAGVTEPGSRQEVGVGIQYYVQLVQALKAVGVEPNVTLYHWDLPQALEARGGWRNPAIVEYFLEYAEVVFAALEPQGVRMWSTVNEPLGICFNGHVTGSHAPGKHDAPGIDPYIVSRHLLLAHARTVHAFRQHGYRGRIGIVLNTECFLPVDAQNPADIEATERVWDFVLHWFGDPVYLTGDWPERMKERCGNRLPPFSEEEKQVLLGSSDYFGLNHYSTRNVTTTGVCNTLRHLLGTLRQALYWEVGILGLLQTVRDVSRGYHYARDLDALITISAFDSVTTMGWPVKPFGLKHVLTHIQERYKPRDGIYITENGSAWPDTTAEECLKDTRRIDFQRGYLSAVHDAIQEGADVRGFYLWSLMDNFEWAWGFKQRFGAFHVDFQTQKRTAKPIVAWYRQVSTTNSLPVEEHEQVSK